MWDNSIVVAIVDSEQKDIKEMKASKNKELLIKHVMLAYMMIIACNR